MRRLIVGPYLNIANNYPVSTGSGGTSYMSYVTTYNLITGKLVRKITDGVYGPNAFAFGP